MRKIHNRCNNTARGHTGVTQEIDVKTD